MSCPLCHETYGSVEHDLKEYRVFKCGACGILYNIDFRILDSASEIFSEDYYQIAQRSAFDHVLGDSKIDPSRQMHEFGLEMVEKSGKGTLLDIGCAFGSFLSLAKNRGWIVKGIEISPYSSNVARHQGFDVQTSTLLDANISEGAIDCISFWDVIEHVEDVEANIAMSSKVLKPKGHLIITTDDYDGIVALIGKMLFLLSLKKWTYPLSRFFIPYNTVYLKRKDLHSVLENNAFEIVLQKGLEYPIDRINLNPIEKVVLATLYWLGGIIRRHNLMMIIARKIS